MNRVGMLSVLFVGSCVAGIGVLTNDVSAQETVARSRQIAAQQNGAAAIADVDDKTSGSNVRVSELIGMDIRNPAGEDIGEIIDLVVDARTGRLKYAAVTYGGFLGFGNKLFAVPFKAFKFQREEPGDDDVVLVLNITQDQLDASEGFDKDRWPNFAEPRFGSDLDRRYGVTREENRQRSVDVDAGRTGVRVDVDNR
jgi:sporulation protein YlmC with PRC-barrel domain